MRLFSVLFAATLPLAAAHSADAQTVLYGTIHGPEGRAVADAQVHVVSSATSFPRPILKTWNAGTDGRFTASIEQAGLYHFWFTGEFHDRYEVPILLEDGDSTEIDVTLKTLPYSNSRDTLRVWRGTRRDGELEQETFTLQSERSDGLFVLPLDIDSDTVEYAVEVDHIYVPRWGQGMRYDELVLNREGRHESLFYPRSTGAREVEIDITEFEPGGNDPSHVFLNASSNTVKFSMVYNDFAERDARARAHTYLMGSQGVQYYEEGYDYDWSGEIRELDRQLSRERDPFTRQARFLARMRAGLSDEWLDYEPSHEFARDLLDAIPPTSALWSYFPSFFGLTLRVATRPERRYRERADDFIEVQNAAAEYADYVYQISHHHTDSTARQTFLGSAVSWAWRGNQFELFEKYYAEYMELYEGTRGAENMRERFRPNKAIAEGNMIPDFRVARLDDRDEYVTRESMFGRTYLMNWWATWCGPCITKMAVIDRIQNAYGSDDFTVLSVSINFSRAEGHRFREKSEWSMPWLNVHVDDWKPEQVMLRDFEVVAIPKSILVGPDGTILAVDDGSDAFYDRLVYELEE